jgi:hypothetical protein
VVRVPAQPNVRVDRHDYSLDPRRVGRRVEVRVSQREVTAICLASGELARRHRRVFAAHRELTSAEHQQALDRLRRERYARTPRGRGRGPLAGPLRRADPGIAYLEAVVDDGGLVFENRFAFGPKL